VTLCQALTENSTLAQERIRIAWAGASPTNAPIWVVEERKLLGKHSLDGEIISISASPIAMQALMSDDLDVTVTSVISVIPSRRRALTADPKNFLDSCLVQ
jgi:ABC-type nitrate/sulfonate/bicarbonate transport system substrate-binding protein